MRLLCFRIQISLDTFKLGRFVGYNVQGCPDGHLHISEGKAGSEPAPGSGTGSGYFCGSVNNKTRNCDTLLLRI